MRRALLISILCCGTAFAGPGQRQPSAQRVEEIADALVAKGYTLTARDWPHVRKTCRAIADAHGWQVNNAPDARVLILLGLGNKHSDPDVLTWPSNRLDRAQRGEKE